MPIDTNNMVWDNDLHFYKLTEDGVKNRLNINLATELSSALEAKVFLLEQTTNIRVWLYAYVRKEFVKVLEKRIADNFDSTYREAIEEALFAQVTYAIRFSGDLEAIQNGDFEKLISPTAKHILKAYGLATKNRTSEYVLDEDYRANY